MVTKPPTVAAATLARMSVSQHIYDIPDDEELDQLIGAATPHFALQIADRIASYIAATGPDHPRAAALQRKIDRCVEIATHGEDGHQPHPDLTPLRP